MPSSDPGFSALDLRAASLLARGEPRSIEDLLEVGYRVLSDSSHIDPDHDHADEARLLLDAASGRPLEDLPLTTKLPRRARERYLSYVARRAAGEPVGLIVGHVRFCGMDIRVSQGIFVPRPSTEALVSEAVARIAQSPEPVVVDLCTGSGAIALAMSNQVAGANIWGVDISPAAIRQAAANARRLRLPTRFRMSDLYQRLPTALRGRIDLITAYVPYLSSEDVASTYTETREYEPIFALLEPSDDPFALLRRLSVRLQSGCVQGAGCS